MTQISTAYGECAERAATMLLRHLSTAAAAVAALLTTGCLDLVPRDLQDRLIQRAGEQAVQRLRTDVFEDGDIHIIVLGSIRAAGEAYETGDLKPRLARYHGDNVECAFRGWNGAWLDPEFEDWNILDSVAHIRVPILIIQGRQDEYGTLAQLEAAKEQAYCPVDTLVLEDCGHAPHLDQGEATLSGVTDFIKQLMVTHHEAEPLALD